MPGLRVNSILLVTLVILYVSGCTTRPPLPPQPVVNSLPPAPSGVITDSSERIKRQLKDDHSAYLLLSRNDDALNWSLALVGDRQRCFIGSLNLDPRALEINTENGLYIEPPELAEELAAKFERLMLPENAWRVQLDEDDQT